MDNNEINYKDFTPREHGAIFKFIKKGEDFIHTFIEGNILRKSGLTPSMVIGKTLFDFLPEKIAQQKHLYYEKAWNGNYVNYEGYLNGVYYLATLNPIKKNSKVVEVIVTAIDITVEKEREIQLQKLEKLSMVGQLAAGIAHEIRNPLTSIKGFTQIVQESIDNEELKKYLSITLDELDRINKIVNEFMLLAQPKEILNIQPTNINTVLSNVIDFMEPQSNMKSIKLKQYFYSTIIGDCDSNQIRQVLINILQNAIEASDNNQDIDITLKDVSDHYLIRVIDKGCGISEERQKKLFEPFYSTKEKGTGLGLMICKRIINVHHGTLKIQSKQGSGTSVHIYLPKNIREPIKSLEYN